MKAVHGGPTGIGDPLECQDQRVKLEGQEVVGGVRET